MSRVSSRVKFKLHPIKRLDCCECEVQCSDAVFSYMQSNVSRFASSQCQCQSQCRGRCRCLSQCQCRCRCPCRCRCLYTEEFLFLETHPLRGATRSVPYSPEAATIASHRVSRHKVQYEHLYHPTGTFDWNTLQDHPAGPYGMNIRHESCHLIAVVLLDCVCK